VYPPNIIAEHRTAVKIQAELRQVQRSICGDQGSTTPVDHTIPFLPPGIVLAIQITQITPQVDHDHFGRAMDLRLLIIVLQGQAMQVQ
jgi:hypothetical protein